MLYVTGITGHTGRFFIERLISENYKEPIRCLVRGNSDTSILDNSGLNIEKVYGSLDDLNFLKESMSGSQIVLHIASILHSNNVTEAALMNQIPWVIYVHTTGRYSSYKSASEEYIKIEDGILRKKNQLGMTILRPTMIYGSSGDRNMYKLVAYLGRHKFFPMFGQGNNLMQPVHARDLGMAYYDVILNKDRTLNKEYNLSGKEPIKYIELVRCVSRALNKKNTIVKIPLKLSLIAAKIYNAITTRAIISVEQVLRMQEDKVFSYAEATKDFNYNPVAFSEGIIEEVQEYKSKIKNEAGR
ncbi:NAD-dependent epimerase/dehydratase family protein [Paenibacillus sp. GCM10012307]|uniref:NmrA family NAD(P)-binding protein n=1 Tax=Paenibacillus roseus TaxID=2798579 RepID=A0A934MVC7_9BACL|nr:NmrA family NAD(P)-binding protein [Paenibacillus roseus]